MLKGERLYEESTGDERVLIDMWLRKFEEALNSRNRENIEDARRELKEQLAELENL